MNDDALSSASSLSDVGDIVSDVRWRLIFRSLNNPKVLDRRYAAKDPIFCDTDAVDFVSLAFHPAFKKEILDHLKKYDALSDEDKEDLLDDALDKGDDDLDAMRNNKTPPSATFTYEKTLTEDDLKNACELEQKLLKDQKSLFASDESGCGEQLITFLAWYGGSVMRNKEDFNSHFIYQGRQGNSVEDIENWLAEWTDEFGNTIGYSGLGAKVPSAATNTAIKPKSDNPNEYALDKSRVNALMGPVEITVSINGGPNITETAMAIIGLGNLKPKTQIIIPFGKVFFQDLNKALAGNILFVPRNSDAEHTNIDELHKRWNGELLAYQNICTRTRKYENDGGNKLYMQAVNELTQYAKTQRLPLDQTPNDFLSSVQSWLASTNNKFADAIIALNHFSQTHFDHKFRFDITRNEVSRVLSDAQRAEIKEIVKIYKEECAKAEISPGIRLNLDREVQPLYEAMLDSLQSDSPYADLKKHRRNRKTDVVKALNSISQTTPMQHAIYTRITEILTNGSIDRSNPISMIDLSSLHVDASAATAASHRKKRGPDDGKTTRRSNRRK